MSTRSTCTVAALLLALALAIAISAGANAAKPPSSGASGSASVFVPNPVQSVGDEQLTDSKDSDAAVPADAYHEVALTHLDGSGFLSGDYARVQSSTGPLAYSATNSFHYTRRQDEFEQVMAYYWVTQAQEYIHSLGFGVTRRPIDNGPQAVRINQLGQDNSFETTQPNPEIRFGKGGVDDAEDAEVILHEYGHAIHDAQNFAFASDEADAISEGFGDYWAVTVSDVVSRALGVPGLEPAACVADWDSTSYTTGVPHCLRRVDTDAHYPENLNPADPHVGGQIWSRALWDIHQALGHVKADTLILQGSFDFPGTSMPDLAARTVAAARSLYGGGTAATVRQAFVARGILN